MTLDEIVGQTVPISILRRGLSTGTLGHAYLLSGDRGLGKETTARAVARELVAQGGPMSELTMITGTDSIKIEHIRELRERASYSTAGNAVWIITDVERMTPEASNAFLKTLEEPRKGTFFFLTTTQVNNLLPTIVSRCLHLPFRSISEADICAWLAERTQSKPDDKKIQSIARLAHGSIGRAWDYWEGPLFERRDEVLSTLVKVPSLSYPEVLGLSLAWPEDRTLVSQDLRLFLSWQRDLLTVKNKLDLALYNPDYEAELVRISEYYSNHTLFQIIQQITEMGQAIKGNARIRFCLGYLLLLMKKGALP